MRTCFILTRLHLKKTFFESCRSYLDFANNAFSGAVHSLCLFYFGYLLVTSQVVSTLAPDVNVLTAVMRVPLDFLDLIVRARLGSSSLP